LRAVLTVDAVFAVAQRHNGAVDRRKPFRDRRTQFRDRRTTLRGQQLTIAPRLPLLIGKELAERLAESVNQSVGLLWRQRIGCIGTPVLHLRSVRLTELPEAPAALAPAADAAPSVLAR
jgi:hypothetical protein